MVYIVENYWIILFVICRNSVLSIFCLRSRLKYIHIFLKLRVYCILHVNINFDLTSEFYYYHICFHFIIVFYLLFIFYNIAYYYYFVMIITFRGDGHLFIWLLTIIVKNVWHYYFPMELK